MGTVNTYHHPAPDIDGTGASLFAVLAKRIDGYAVYEGIVRLPASNSKEYRNECYAAAVRVSLRGRKCTYERALTYFPNLVLEEYAR
jgi:hypothetical protein